ncbi:uncharacterized protein LOC114077933 isoform X2 [Solanum pennellii]|uniref:Uncharacterized protein LOC114077933 isoform X2 n=1 Tax=Solanum pennellii TaxID=28526 RepID=A0ABM1VEG9_SOLPN|nr:uncharacterized protein LOC114077933 isoform X2 [Solanum pennellii]
MAIVRIQIGLTKVRPNHVWLGYVEENLTKGQWQRIEYESITAYCYCCEHQGHDIHICTTKVVDEYFHNRKKIKKTKQNKCANAVENPVQKHGGEVPQVVKQIRFKRRLNRCRMYKIMEIIYSSKGIKKQFGNLQSSHKELMDSQQHPVQTGIIPSIPIHNDFDTLDMQEQDTSTVAQMQRSSSSPKDDHADEQPKLNKQEQAQNLQPTFHACHAQITVEEGGSAESVV